MATIEIYVSTDVETDGPPVALDDSKDRACFLQHAR